MIRLFLVPGLLESLALITFAGSLVFPATAEPALEGSTPQEREQVAEAIRTFHRALEEGDSATALALLAQDAFVLESGGVESRDEYLAHHLQADMAFAAEVSRTSELLRVTVIGDAAWVVSSTHALGEVGGRSIDSRGAELAVLSREGEGWRIRAIHWSSRR